MAIRTMAVLTRCDALTKDLRVDGWPALTIHGDKAQEVLTPYPTPTPNPNPNFY